MEPTHHDSLSSSDFRRLLLRCDLEGMGKSFKKTSRKALDGKIQGPPPPAGGWLVCSVPLVLSAEPGLQGKPTPPKLGGGL